MFERRIGSNTKASNKDGDYTSSNTPLPQSVMTINGTIASSHLGNIYTILYLNNLWSFLIIDRVGPNIQATSATPMAPLFDEYNCMGEEHLNDNTSLPESVLTNNGKY